MRKEIEQKLLEFLKTTVKETLNWYSCKYGLDNPPEEILALMTEEEKDTLEKELSSNVQYPENYSKERYEEIYNTDSLIYHLLFNNWDKRETRASSEIKKRLDERLKVADKIRGFLDNPEDNYDLEDLIEELKEVKQDIRTLKWVLEEK